MKKFSETGQQKPADDVAPVDTDEQASKRLKTTDELRYFLWFYRPYSSRIL